MTEQYKMSLHVADIYNLRGCIKLPLPKIVQDHIASLRITPAAYKPIRPVHKFNHGHHNYKKHNVAHSDNWREKTITEVARRIKEYDDPEYHQIVSLLNKVTKSSLNKLCDDTVELILKRDEVFRIRIVSLIVSNAVSQHFFAELMAMFVDNLCKKMPEIKEDLKSHLSMFDKLYDVSNIVLYPEQSDPEFDDKVIAWMKHKDSKRSYAKFMVHLYNRDLITIEDIMTSMDIVFTDVTETCQQPKTKHTEENATQLVDFIFEVAKASSTRELKDIVLKFIPSILSLSREKTPSLCMRSRFKLEDALKCVQ